jgi:hypothetical protein
VWYSDWSNLSEQPLPHEELYRSVTFWSKSSGMWCNRRSEITGISLSGSSLQCGAAVVVHGIWFALSTCTVPPCFSCRAGLGAGGQQVEFRIFVKHLRLIFLKIRDVYFYVRTTYNVIHIFFNIFTFSFFWTLEGVEGSIKSKESPPPEDCKSLIWYCAQDEWQQKSVPVSGIFF